MGESRLNVSRPWACAIAAIAVSAGLAALPGSAGESGDQPTVSPDRLDDATIAAGDPFVAADNFAWRAFIALNWPSKLGDAERGVPNRSKSLGDVGKRVWETFKSDYELFEVDANNHPASPAPWASYDGRNPCGADVDNRGKTVAAFAPFADFNQPSFAPGEPGNPLVAQNGAYTRYEIRFNDPEFSTIAANGWRPGQNLPDASHAARFPIGSIAVKAAWRPLTAADPPAMRARYYVESAEIVDVAKTLAAGRLVCSTSDVALVGLHIVIKTKGRPQRIWSTFEHVDNVPPVGAGEAREPDAKDAGAPYSYFDPSRQNRLWPPFGSTKALPVSWSNPPEISPRPMQVVRRYPVHPSTMAMNRAYWALPGVKGTVWERYMLVAAQWPTSAGAYGPDNDGAYFPGRTEAPNEPTDYRSTAKAQENLINTAMETYFQDSPSSCMACHHAVSNAHGGDFVGVLAGSR